MVSGSVATSASASVSTISLHAAEIEALRSSFGEDGANLASSADLSAELKGLLQAKPITYWDYIQVDTLLSLQKTRTDFKDEEIFVMYHQVTELTLKMMIHEIKQLSEGDNLSEEIWLTKLDRLKRYTRMLITSFDIMKDGMSYEDYNTFRATLTPASGFQSAQFRILELYSTRLENLINSEGRERLPLNPTFDDYFKHIYWKDAGLDRKTGKMTLTLRLFIEKYEIGTISDTNGYFFLTVDSINQESVLINFQII